MDQAALRLLEDHCIQDHAPACTAACPVRVDGRGLCAEMERGNYSAALAIYRKNIPFPRILSRICDQPCRDACLRKELGGAIQIAALEKACVDFGDPGPAPSKLPSRGKDVAIIGSGLSGLTAAFDLARKGYHILIFEKLDRLGGSLWKLPRDILPSDSILSDLAVLESLGIEIFTSTDIQQINAGENRTFELSGKSVHAIYLGTGGETTDAFALETNGKRKITIDPITCQTHREGIFSGGGAIAHQPVAIGDPPTRFNRSPIIAILDGHRAATSIDRYLQRVSLTASRIREGGYETRLYTNLAGIKSQAPVQPAVGSHGYSQKEAQAEAARCIQCQCMECVKNCLYLEEYGSYPKRYLREIYNNLSIVKGERQKNQFINSCSLCGLCAELCPEDLNMGQVCLDARQTMVTQDRMPLSAHEFALRDLTFSNGEFCSLVRPAPGGKPTRYLFFPGCQLNGSKPGNVTSVYNHLLDLFGSSPDGSVGLALRCCGAPAEWAGRTDLFEETRSAFLAQVQNLGNPEIIVACSSCYQVFTKTYPDLKVTSLWSILDNYGLPQIDEIKSTARTLVIHDPCSTRYEMDIQEHARNLIKKNGYNIQELPLNRNLTECCGYGGLVWLANRPLADRIARRRTQQSELDYVTYCAMCRDFYARQGKTTFHLLDLIFNPDLPPELGQSGPDYSSRRENRVRLKRSMLRTFWSEEMPPDPTDDIKLILSPDIRSLMEDRRILIEDIQQVIQQAENGGQRLYNEKTGCYLAYACPGNVTYWVEYSHQGDAYQIHNTYSHRMVIRKQAAE